jgi:hypothetical protein
MLFHLTTEGHIRTSNEPELADADAGGGSFASERDQILGHRSKKTLILLHSPRYVQQNADRNRAFMHIQTTASRMKHVHNYTRSCALPALNWLVNK